MRKKTRKRNPQGGSYWPYLLFGAGIYLLYRRSRGIGDPPKTEPFPSFPSDEEVIPDSTLAIQFGMTASDIAAAKRALGPLTQGRMEALLQQQQRDRAYYEGLRPQKKNIEQLLAAETNKLTGKQPSGVVGAAPRQTTPVPQMQFPIPALEPGQFSIDGVPQPKSVTPGATLAPTGITGQYHLQPPQAMQDYWAKEAERQRTSFWKAAKAYDPFGLVETHTSAPDVTKLFEAGRKSSGDDTDPVTSAPKAVKELSASDAAVTGEVQQMPPRSSQPVKKEIAKEPSGPSVMRYTDEFGRTMTFDQSKVEGIGSRTIGPGAADPYQARLDAKKAATAMEAMAPAKLSPDEAFRKSVQPIPSWQLDFRIDDPAQQKVAADAEKTLKKSLGTAANAVADKYKKAGMTPVNSDGSISGQGKVMLTLEQMDNDTRAKYINAARDRNALVDQKESLDSEYGYNKMMITGEAGGDKLKGEMLEEYKKLTKEDKENLKRRNGEIEKEVGQVNKKIDAHGSSPAGKLMKAVEAITDNLYSAAEKKVKQEAVQRAEQQERETAAQKASQTPAEYADKIAKTGKTFDPGTKSFEQESKAFAPAISPFDQNLEAKGAAFQQQIQQQKLAAAATRGGFIQQQMDKVKQMTAAAAQPPASGWFKQVASLPQQIRTPSYTVTYKKKSTPSSGGGAPPVISSGSDSSGRAIGGLSGLFELPTV